MAIIRRIQGGEGVSEELGGYLVKAERRRTSKVYDNVWKTWVIWCEKRRIDSEEYDAQRVLQFLIDNN